MTTADWDKTEIKKLAAESGRPLEVECAEALLNAGWQVRLGTFFTDVASEKIRELDFLAQKTATFAVKDVNQELMNWELTIRVLGSCKGFPPEYSPVTYSVFSNSQTVETPSFICYETGAYGQGVANLMKRQSSNIFLSYAGRP
jgi:hypothetical protein